jgi:hypothetical protein
VFVTYRKEPQVPSIEFTPEAIGRVREMYTWIGQADAEDAKSYPIVGTKEERERWTEGFKQRQTDRRDNVLGVLITMIGLGGSLAADGATDLIGRNEFITYGINKSSHNDVNCWSVNS